MSWVSVLAGFFVAHMVGDYLLQTDWQARHKAGGLGRDAVGRRALLAHVATYTLAFVPAFIWIGDELGTGGPFSLPPSSPSRTSSSTTAASSSLYLTRVKHAEATDARIAGHLVDQSFHAGTYVARAIGQLSLCGATLNGAGARLTIIDGNSNDRRESEQRARLGIAASISGGDDPRRTSRAAPAADGGDRIYADGGALAISNSHVVGNTAPSGGGIFSVRRTATCSRWPSSTVVREHGVRARGRAHRRSSTAATGRVLRIEGTTDVRRRRSRGNIATRRRTEQSRPGAAAIYAERPAR